MSLVPCREALFDEVVAVELGDRKLGLDEALLLVEVLQVGEPLRVHGADLALAPVGALGVVSEDLLHQLFLALERGRGLHIGERGFLRIVHDELHALERRLHDRAHHLRPLCDHLVGGQDRLRHRLEIILGGERYRVLALQSFLDVDLPIRRAGAGIDAAGDDEARHSGRSDRLGVHVVLGDVLGGERAEQRVVGRVLEGEHGYLLAAQILELLDAAILAADHDGHGAAAHQPDRLHGHAVAAHDDRGVADGTADRRIADADLFGHVDAAARDHEINVVAGISVVAEMLREHPRRKRWQARRSGEEIGDLLGGKRRRGEQARAQRGGKRRAR